MWIQKLKKRKLCIALDFRCEVGWKISWFSKLYNTGFHKDEYVLNFEEVRWYPALPPLEDLEDEGKVGVVARHSPLRTKRKRT